MQGPDWSCRVDLNRLPTGSKWRSDAGRHEFASGDADSRRALPRAIQALVSAASSAMFGGLWFSRRIGVDLPHRNRRRRQTRR